MRGFARHFSVLSVLSVLSILLLSSPVSADGPPYYYTQWGSIGTGNGEFSNAYDVAVDTSGNVYVADTFGNRIQKFDSEGTYLGQWGSPGSSDGEFDYPFGIATDDDDNVYVADKDNDRIQKFDSNGNFLTKWGSEGSGDGQLNGPFGIAVADDGSIYVSELYNNRVQKFVWDVGTSSYVYSTKWGVWGSGDGQFKQPRGIAIDSSGDVYVAEDANDRIQKFDSDGTFLTKWGSEGSGDGQFKDPYGVAVDADGNVYVVDSTNDRVQKFTYNAGTSTYDYATKWGAFGTGDGQFWYPAGIALHPNGDVYIADQGNNRIQVFTYRVVSVDLDLKTGWNMVSVPVQADDMSASAIFPGVDAVYTWDPSSKSYTMPTTIESKKGYWVAVSSDRNLSVVGMPVTEWEDGLLQGWNMIGSVYGGTIDFSDPDDDPNGSCEGFCYCWNPSGKCYDYETDICTGVGYWAACTSPCQLGLGPA